jgi:hypothetical protein
MKMPIVSERTNGVVNESEREEKSYFSIWLNWLSSTALHQQAAAAYTHIFYLHAICFQFQK